MQQQPPSCFKKAYVARLILFPFLVFSCILLHATTTTRLLHDVVRPLEQEKEVLMGLPDAVHTTSQKEDSAVVSSTTASKSVTPHSDHHQSPPEWEMMMAEADYQKQQQPQQQQKQQPQMSQLKPYHPEEDRDFMTLESLPMRFQNVSVGAPRCRSLKPEDVSYTLVTQTSENRLWMMEEHCRRWGQENPISIAVYSTKPEDTLSSLHKRLRGMGCRPDLLTVQLLSDANSTMEDYPVNVLRNMALRAVQTTHVAYIDMDFWVSVDLYDNLMLPHVRKHVAADPKAAIMIPAFMFVMECDRRSLCRSYMPGNRTELLTYFRKKVPPKVTLFGRYNNVGAHGTTRYNEWVKQSAQELLPIPCTKSNRYEPYLVVRWCNKLPPFQEIFSGYGKNKISWVMQLRRAGWTMHQIGESFLVHYPHKESEARVAWDGGPNAARFFTDKIFIKFKHWLMTEVPDEMRLEACGTAMNDDSLLWVNKK